MREVQEDARVRCLLVDRLGEAVHECQGGEAHRACAQQKCVPIPGRNRYKRTPPELGLPGNKMRVDVVKVEDIKGSPPGIKGWAAKWDEPTRSKSPALNQTTQKNKGSGKERCNMLELAKQAVSTQAGKRRLGSC